MPLAPSLTGLTVRESPKSYCASRKDGRKRDGANGFIGRHAPISRLRIPQLDSYSKSLPVDFCAAPPFWPCFWAKCLRRHFKGFCCNDIGSRCAGAVGELRPPGRSCGAIEQVGDDDGLAPDIMTVNLSKLSLPHHRHGFETRQSSPRGMETAEAEPRPH